MMMPLTLLATKGLATRGLATRTCLLSKIVLSKIVLATKGLATKGLATKGQLCPMPQAAAGEAPESELTLSLRVPTYVTRCRLP